MSAAPRSSSAPTTFKTWDAYVDEAAIEPFTIPALDDEGDLVVAAPHGVALGQVVRGIRTGDLELCIRAVLGEQWERMHRALSRPGVSHKAMTRVLEDMLDHFELYEDVVLVGPQGDRVTKRRPSDINPLINAGYRSASAGEARASS